jgi:hypothetical protein
LHPATGARIVAVIKRAGRDCGRKPKEMEEWATVGSVFKNGGKHGGGVAGGFRQA